MKKIFYYLFSLLFFFVVFMPAKIENKSYGFSGDYERYYHIYIGEDLIKYNTTDFKSKFKFSAIQSEIYKKNVNNFTILKYLYNFNFSKEEIVFYIFPEIKFILEDLEKKFCIVLKDENVEVLKNECELKFINTCEKYIDKEKFYDDVIKQINNVKFDLHVKFISNNKLEKIKENYTTRGEFQTDFSSSSVQRKNNIKRALKSLDGVVVENGEIFSFNKATGIRNESTGYQKAKIISNGTFIEGFGGGVCQVSTTLYNAAILSGLEILEVHNHSLPVSYVEPSFDAMVNAGSSDLVLKNNTGGNIIITTSFQNDICKIKIFGIKNKFIIKKKYKKLENISAEKDIIDIDYLKYNLELLPGEEKRISYAKDGFYSNGYLEFYDLNGNFVEEKLIRQNVYYPTKGIVVKREK